MKLEKYDGFWQGKPIKYSVVLIQVTNLLGGIRHWARGIVGKKRQSVKVSISGLRPFYLDNEDGTGLKTVQSEKLKKPIHRNLGEPKEIKEVSKKDWIKKVDKAATKAIKKESEDYWNKKGRKKSAARGHGSGGHGSK